MSFIGSELLKLGFPADAARVFNDLLGSRDDMNAAAPYFGGSERMVEQAEQGLQSSLYGWTASSRASTLQTLLKPVADNRGDALDLVLLVNPRELNKAAVLSLFEAALTPPSDQPALLKEVQSSVEKLVKQYPDDISVQTAAALVASMRGDTSILAEAAGRLEKLAEALPLEVLSRGRPPQGTAADRGGPPDSALDRGPRLLEARRYQGAGRPPRRSRLGGRAPSVRPALGPCDPA